MPIAVQYEEEWYHAGSCCLIAKNLAITAKHILEWMYLQVAKQTLDLYDPDLKDPDHGYKIRLPGGLGIDVFLFLTNGNARRFSVAGFYKVGFKENDVILLKLAPHPNCDYRNEPIELEVPTFDLVPPRVGLHVKGVGFPDHPEHEHSKLPAEHYSGYHLYRSEGEVEAINSEVGSAPVASFQTSMKTTSGLSGGPVFVEREQGNVCCGIVSRGGMVDYSLITPLWTIAAAQIHPVDNMPIRYGASCMLDLMQAGIIPAIGAEKLKLINYIEKEEFRILCENPELLRNGF